MVYKKFFTILFLTCSFIVDNNALINLKKLRNFCSKYNELPCDYLNTHLKRTFVSGSLFATSLVNNITGGNPLITALPLLISLKCGIDSLNNNKNNWPHIKAAIKIAGSTASSLYLLKHGYTKIGLGVGIAGICDGITSLLARKRYHFNTNNFSVGDLQVFPEEIIVHIGRQVIEQSKNLPEASKNFRQFACALLGNVNLLQTTLLNGNETPSFQDYFIGVFSKRFNLVHPFILYKTLHIEMPRHLKFTITQNIIDRVLQDHQITKEEFDRAQMNDRWFTQEYSIRDPLMYYPQEFGYSKNLIVGLLKFLNKKIDPNSHHFSTNPLIEATRINNHEAIELLLKVGFDPNVESKYEYFPLLRINKSNVRAIKLLLDAGADPNKKDPSGNTTLTKAVKDNNIKAIELLLAAGANPNAGKKTLIFAVEQLDVEMIKLLLSAGADPDIKDTMDNTSLVILLRKLANHVESIFHNKPSKSTLVEIITLLLDAKANPDIHDHWGDTCLTYAVKKCKPEIVKLLIDFGVNPDTKASYGSTPLMIAVRNHNIENVKLLLAAGADKNLCDILYETPLTIAQGKGYTEIEKLLNDNGNEDEIIEQES